MAAILEQQPDLEAGELLKAAVDYKFGENEKKTPHDWVNALLKGQGASQRKKPGIVKHLEADSIVQVDRQQNQLVQHIVEGVYEPSHVINMCKTAPQQALMLTTTLTNKEKRNVIGSGDCRRDVHHTTVWGVRLDGTKLSAQEIFRANAGDEIPPTQITKVKASEAHAAAAIAKPTNPPKQAPAAEQRRI